MSARALLARERFGLRLFAAGALAALVLVGLLWLPQLRVIAAAALVQALLGVALCAWGMRERVRRPKG